MTRFDADVSLTTQTIERLLRCGVEASKASYEGYKYAYALLEGYKRGKEKKRIVCATLILERATLQAGIHTTQLKKDDAA